ncbi:MAG: hypothetical protein ACYYK0_03905 [Candidatus Eutrophobiaceae bacterium]
MSELIKIVLLATALLMPFASQASDEFKTEATVRYVLGCMNKLGGLKDQNLYTCICRHDAIKAQMAFSDYEDGLTFERNKPMTGEKGGFFRDNDYGKEKFEKLQMARENAENQCPKVKQIATPKQKQ